MKGMKTKWEQKGWLGCNSGEPHRQRTASTPNQTSRCVEGSRPAGPPAAEPATRRAGRAIQPNSGRPSQRAIQPSQPATLSHLLACSLAPSVAHGLALGDQLHQAPPPAEGVGGRLDARVLLLAAPLGGHRVDGGAHALQVGLQRRQAAQGSAGRMMCVCVGG